ncbi:EAL domain-containing protein [Acuticoccus sp. MNP-M23]|uniref:putative bifunctional diguanylate cyclase/phosphodiesterase n=1 Tax=Acuticoccus sp. MNP-M23 TaxID=3072793 RepID=UPI00281565D0|nr:EAL domain-containing protein [Acuticoccus sp. MNP-M23]WMS44051.1 EAL domain-containing protein [Acuticoccus sp. MNP-M23]
MTHAQPPREGPPRDPPRANGSASRFNEVALPAYTIRAARLAEFAAQILDMPLALIHLPGFGDTTIYPLAEEQDFDTAPYVRAWQAPEIAGVTTLIDPALPASTPIGIAVSIPVTLFGRDVWIAAIDPGRKTASERDTALAALLHEIGGDYGQRVRAAMMWTNRLTEEVALHEKVQALAGVGTIACHGDSGTLTVSERVLRIMRLRDIDSVENLSACFAPHDRAAVRDLLSGTHGNGPRSGEYDIDNPDGTMTSVRIRRMMLDPEAEVEAADPAWIATVEDISDHRTALRAAEHTARHDPLTEILNANAFGDAVSSATTRAQKSETMAGLLLISLDTMRNTEQHFARANGDAVLRFAARALTANVRTNDVVLRLSGEEFAIVMDHVTDEDGLMRRARIIKDALESNVSIGDEASTLSASIGVAIYPDDTTTGLDLYDAASFALSEATRSGVSSVHRYNPLIRDKREKERKIIEDVRLALKDDEFTPFFQPKVDLESGLVVGFEALCRWIHPQRGILTPGAFMPAFNAAGIGAELSDVSMVGAFRAASQFSRMSLDFGHIAVNLNALQLHRANFLDMVEALQSRYKVPASRIVFEVLENVLIREKHIVQDNLHALCDAGFTIALDDFGTGFASLKHIREPFIREIKIDRSFITHAGSSASDQQIVTAIVQMARKLGLQMVAEGIEDEETLRKLRAIGCTVGQGFVFAPALPFDEAAEFLGRQRRIYALLQHSGL